MINGDTKIVTEFKRNEEGKLLKVTYLFNMHVCISQPGPMWNSLRGGGIDIFWNNALFKMFLFLLLKHGCLEVWVISGLYHTLYIV